MSLKIKKVNLGKLELSVWDKNSQNFVASCVRDDKNSDKIFRLFFLRFSTLIISLFVPRLRRKLQGIELLCPGSALMRWCCRRLLAREQPQLVVKKPFQEIVSILTMLNQQCGSLFLLGGNRKNLAAAEDAILRSFPQLQILGRYHGKGRAYSCDKVYTTIKKCSADVLLVGEGRFTAFGFQAGQHLQRGIVIIQPTIIKTFARFQRSYRRRNKFGKNFAFLRFLLPWTWLQLPFAIFFVIVVITKSRRKNV